MVFVLLYDSKPTVQRNIDVAQAEKNKVIPKQIKVVIKLQRL